MATVDQSREARHRRMIERRRQVAQLRLSGLHDQRQIADALKVSQPTISDDFAALDIEFLETAAADTRRHKGLDLQRIERMLQALWPAVLRGQTSAVHEANLLLARKAAILGYEAPRKLAAAVADATPTGGAPNGVTGPVLITTVTAILPPGVGEADGWLPIGAHENGQAIREWPDALHTNGVHTLSATETPEIEDESEDDDGENDG